MNLSRSSTGILFSTIIKNSLLNVKYKINVKFSFLRIACSNFRVFEHRLESANE